MIDWDSDPELRKLRREFAESFAERLAAVRLFVKRLRAQGPGAFSLGGKIAQELRIIAHNLAGAASTYGFEELGKIAAGIDDRLSVPGVTVATEQLLADALLLENALISFSESPASGAKPGFF